MDIIKGRDGRGAEARAIIRALPDATVRELMTELATVGIRRRKTWVTEARLAEREVVKIVDAMTPGASPTALRAATGLTRAEVTRMRTDSLNKRHIRDRRPIGGG